jgi:hypothetical protein
MAVPLYMDVHVPQAISDQLRRRGVDVLTAIDDGREEDSDAALLARATERGRVIFPQDIRFRAMAEDCQRRGHSFAGLLFANQLGTTIGSLVRDLELIAKATAVDEWQDVVCFLPL